MNDGNTPSDGNSTSIGEGQNTEPMSAVPSAIEGIAEKQYLPPTASSEPEHPLTPNLGPTAQVSPTTLPSNLISPESSRDPGAPPAVGALPQTPPPFMPPAEAVATGVTPNSTGVTMAMMPEASAGAVAPGIKDPFLSPETSHIDTMPQSGPSAVSAQPSVTPVATTTPAGSTSNESNSDGGVREWFKKNILRQGN